VLSAADFGTSCSLLRRFYFLAMWKKLYEITNLLFNFGK